MKTNKRKSMHKNRFNKRGQLSDLITDPLSLVVIAFLILILYIVSMASMTGMENGVKETAAKVSLSDQEHYSLQAFLQKPVELNVNGKIQTLTIADIIRLNQIDQRYKSIIDSETAKLEGYQISIGGAPEQLGPGQFYIPSNQTIKIAATKAQ